MGMETLPVILLDFDNKRIVQIVPGSAPSSEVTRALELAHATPVAAQEASQPPRDESA
jgi:hypothetical protein